MKQKDILLLIIVFFVGALAYMIFTVLYNKYESTISEALAVQSAPINPNFDMKTFNSVKQRPQIDPLYSLPKAQPTPTPSVAFVIPSKVQVATPSAIP